ncbi:hypothetical protein B566_EDAN014196 [Ephemera danica]|nr:hypothetical protein B566_EDAN014196 [Ephemera danica]
MHRGVLAINTGSAKIEKSKEITALTCKHLRNISDMKLILVMAAALMALATAKPQSGKDATILAYSNDVGLQGYNFAWVAADGQTYTVTYVADENGFQPQGAHLPGASRR